MFSNSRRLRFQGPISELFQPSAEVAIGTNCLVCCITFLMGCGQQSTQPKEPKPQPPIGYFHVHRAAFSPDNKLLVTHHCLDLGDGKLNHLNLWDVASGKLLRSFKGHQLSSFAFLPDGKTMLWGSLHKPLRIWDVVTDKEIRTFRPTFGEEALRVNCLSLSPDGRLVLTGGGQEIGSVNLWDVASGELQRTFQWRHGLVHGVALSPDGKLALAGMNPTAGYDNTARLWEAATGKQIKNFARSQGWGAPFAFSSESKFIILGRSDQSDFRQDKLVLWELARDKDIWTIPEPSSFVLTPDGKSLLAAHSDGKVRRWDLSTGREIWSVVVNPYGRFGYFAFSPDGTLALSAGGSDKVDIDRGLVWLRGIRLELWDTDHGKLLRTLESSSEQ